MGIHYLGIEFNLKLGNEKKKAKAKLPILPGPLICDPYELVGETGGSVTSLNRIENNKYNFASSCNGN